MKKIKFKRWKRGCPWYVKGVCWFESEKCKESVCKLWPVLEDFKYDNAKK